MKRALIFALGALLVIGATAQAGPYEQDKTDRPRRIALSASGFLGVEIDEVTRDVAGRLRLGQERGVLITGVTGDTAAAKAGLQKDDVIIKWNGEPIEGTRELGRHLRETPAGRTVKLGVLRNGSEMEIAVTLGERAAYIRPLRVTEIAPRAYVARPATAARVQVRQGYPLGISLQSMSPQLAEYFGLQNRNGALVTFVHPDSPAARAGIKAGDVILSVGGEAVENPLRVVQALRGKGEGAVEVKVMRDRKERSLTVQLDKKTSFNWSPDDDVDVVIAEAAGEPFVVGPIDIKPLRFAPVVVPRIKFAPLPPVAVPEINIAPVVVPPVRIAPRALPPIRIAPVVVPRLVMPRIDIPKVVVPPVRIVIPDMHLRIQV